MSYEPDVISAVQAHEYLAVGWARSNYMKSRSHDTEYLPCNLCVQVHTPGSRYIAVRDSYMNLAILTTLK